MVNVASVGKIFTTIVVLKSLARQARVLDTAGRVEQFRRRYGSNAKGA